MTNVIDPPPTLAIRRPTWQGRRVDRPPPSSRWPAYATIGAYVISVLLPLVEVTRIAVFEPPSDAWVAVIATALYLP